MELSRQAITQQKLALQARGMITPDLIEKEKVFQSELRLILWQMDHSRKNYDPYKHESIYSQWFALRTEGEQRGLWNFIPTKNDDSGTSKK